MSKLSQSNLVNQENILLKRISQGDNSSFWELWNNHKDYLYSYCLTQMNNNTVDAQETLSISMLKAWDKLPNYAAKITNIRGWLRRLTQNVCIDFYREKKRGFTTTENIESFPQFQRNYSFTIIDYPDKFMMRDELKMVLYQEINKLNDSLKIPLIMRFIQTKAYQKIAEDLNISEANVRKRIQKARAILRKRIEFYLRGCNHLDSLANVDKNFDSFNDLQLEELLKLTDQKLPLVEPNLEEIFYRLYTTHLEILPSPLLTEELAYV